MKKALRKEILFAFWSRVERGENRLTLLREYSTKGMPSKIPARVRRRQFERDWQMRKKLKNEPCWCCRRERATERHHIVLIVHGGPNCKENIVPLCVGCHSRVHPWMEKPLVELPPEHYTPLWRSVRLVI